MIMNEGERGERFLLLDESRTETPPHAAAMQFAIGALGTGMGLVSGCAALSIASLGALHDSSRYALGARPARWRWTFPAMIAVALAAVAASVSGTQDNSGWMMIAIGVLGLAINAACVLALFPHRATEFGAACGRASSAAYLVLLGAGALTLVQPAAWLHLLAAALIAVLLAAGLWAELRIAK